MKTSIKTNAFSLNAQIDSSHPTLCVDMEENCTLFDLPVMCTIKQIQKPSIQIVESIHLHTVQGECIYAATRYMASTSRLSRTRSLDAFLNLQVITEHSLSFGYIDWKHAGAAR